MDWVGVKLLGLLSSYFNKVNSTIFSQYKFYNFSILSDISFGAREADNDL
jgi:hypothetical protein